MVIPIIPQNRKTKQKPLNCKDCGKVICVVDKDFYIHGVTIKCVCGSKHLLSMKSKSFVNIKVIK